MYYFLCLVLITAVGGNIASTTSVTTTVAKRDTAGPSSQSSAPTTNSTSIQKTTVSSQGHTTKLQTTSTSLKQEQGCPKSSQWAASILCNIDPKLILLVTGALLMACIVLLLSTLILACKLCSLKNSMGVTAQFTSTRECVDFETGPLMTETRQEGDRNQSGPEGPEQPEEPEQTNEEAAEATEVSNQASAEDPTQCVTPAAEEPPNQENGTSGQIIFDATEE